MKTNKYIVAFDMLPLSKERLESWDYNSMIFSISVHKCYNFLIYFLCNMHKYFS